MAFKHVSVLLEETVDQLITRPDGVYVDCTLGGAGHAHAIGERLTSEGTLIGFDQDEDALMAAKERLNDLSCKVVTIQSNFSNLKEELLKRGYYQIDGFVFDLGVSSYQLDTAERGFSYMQDGPLDMRMDKHGAKDAANMVNTESPEELERVLKEYGEERWAKRIVQFIVTARSEAPITTTGQLVDIIKKAIPAGARKDGPHPAKRTFQALRIAVNGELEILRQSFTDAVSLLRPKGRICVITFHSLEDRITKETFTKLGRGCICPPELPVCICHHLPEIKGGRKIILPSDEEIAENPRSRSAKLRVAIKLDTSNE